MAQQLAKKDDDRDDEADYSPFTGIEKGSVLQEARVFNDPQLDARRCSQVITKLLYLLNQGETFTKTEATEVFFAVTKLFQSRDMGLRRMVYLMIKEISPSADEVIIVTSSLMKDMNSKIDMYKANAIRVLCRITDGTLLTQIERYIKQAIVDKNPVVASAALVSGIHLLQTNPEIVKRWSNEVQEAVQSRAALVQFHALGLLHQIRQNDRLAVSKLVSSLTRGTVRSPLAQCLLIRYTSQVIHESGNNTQSGDRPFYDYLESCLRHKSEMVIFEAARAITELNGVTSRELTPAITVLQLFLSSSKPVLRFAAVRTLNKVAMIHPTSVTNCNIDMESLISDQNRSIATLAITTLLKTGNESSVDRLMKQITNFMSDIADEFKIVVVEAIRSLCQKFPLKYRSLMNFLSNILREEGGFEYKKAIVDSIVILIREIPDAKETGLLHLCEFIEDCEFTYLSTQILHFLGIEGPKTSDPSKYIRFIYNRVHLENATVRAGAVSTLAKFGAAVDALKPRIFVLLRRCLFDSDDEVRDRATLYLNTIGGDGSVVETDNAVKDFLFGPFDIPLVNLETSLKNYEPSEEAFDIDSVPKEVKSQPLAEKKAAGKKPTGLGAPPSAPSSQKRRRSASNEVVYVDPPSRNTSTPRSVSKPTCASNNNTTNNNNNNPPRRNQHQTTMAMPRVVPVHVPSKASISPSTQGYVNQGRRVQKEAIGISGELESMINDHQKSKGSGNLVRASSGNVMLFGNLGNIRQGDKNDSYSIAMDNYNQYFENSNSNGGGGGHKKKNVVSISNETKPPMNSGGGSLCRAISTRMDPEQLKIMGNEDYKNGRFAEALALYDAAISIDPKKASYRSNRSAALTGLGRLLEAVFECREAIQIDPHYHRAHHRLGNLHLRLGETDKALYHYKQAGPEADPDEVAKVKILQAHLNKCTEARRLGDWNTLITEASNTISSGADSAPQIFALQAEALIKLRRHHDADNVMSKGPNFDVDDCTKFFGPIGNANLLVTRAQVDLAAGRFDDALEAAQKAARLDSNNKAAMKVLRKARAVTAARGRGNDLFKASKFSEACIAYGEGLENDPCNAVLLCNRAACRLKLGQLEKAVEDCCAALSLRPSYTKARMRRADCNAKLERWEASIADYEILLRGTPEDEEVNRALLEARVQLKKQRGG